MIFKCQKRNCRSQFEPRIQRGLFIKKNRRTKIEFESQALNPVLDKGPFGLLVARHYRWAQLTVS